MGDIDFGILDLGLMGLILLALPFVIAFVIFYIFIVKSDNPKTNIKPDIKKMCYNVHTFDVSGLESYKKLSIVFNNYLISIESGPGFPFIVLLAPLFMVISVLITPFLEDYLPFSSSYIFLGSAVLLAVLFVFYFLRLRPKQKKTDSNAITFDADSILEDMLIEIYDEPFLVSDVRVDKSSSVFEFSFTSATDEYKGKLSIADAAMETNCAIDSSCEKSSDEANFKKDADFFASIDKKPLTDVLHTPNKYIWISMSVLMIIALAVSVITAYFALQVDNSKGSFIYYIEIILSLLVIPPAIIIGTHAFCKSRMDNALNIIGNIMSIRYDVPIVVNFLSGKAERDGSFKFTFRGSDYDIAGNGVIDRYDGSLIIFDNYGDEPFTVRCPENSKTIPPFVIIAYIVVIIAVLANFQNYYRDYEKYGPNAQSRNEWSEPDPEWSEPDSEPSEWSEPDESSEDEQEDVSEEEPEANSDRESDSNTDVVANYDPFKEYLTSEQAASLKLEDKSNIDTGYLSDIRSGLIGFCKKHKKLLYGDASFWTDTPSDEYDNLSDYLAGANYILAIGVSADVSNSKEAAERIYDFLNDAVSHGYKITLHIGGQSPYNIDMVDNYKKEKLVSIMQKDIEILGSRAYRAK